MSEQSYIARTSGLKAKDYLGYAMVDAAGCLVFALVTTLLQKFYTDIFHLSPLFIMIMFIIARVWGGINDPIMGRICEYDQTGLKLFPTHHAKIAVDNDYIMASLGVLSVKHREGAIRLLEKSLGFKFEKPEEGQYGIKSTAQQGESGGAFDGPTILEDVAAELAAGNSAGSTAAPGLAAPTMQPVLSGHAAAGEDDGVVLVEQLVRHRHVARALLRRAAALAHSQGILVVLLGMPFRQLERRFQELVDLGFRERVA